MKEPLNCDKSPPRTGGRVDAGRPSAQPEKCTYSVNGPKLLYSAELHCTALHCTALDWTAQHCSAAQRSALQCSAV